ncbi:MAG: hypothetical protein OEL87_03145, partial [Nanoarchaeota archaeon]|nr:hypothetical protein [Nanoarchaeota archaeon]
FILYSDKNNRANISPAWLRKEFRQVAKNAKLDEVYGIAEDINNPLSHILGERKLYRLTTHSLRHYFITKVYGDCKDPLKTQKLARHGEFKSTQNYIHLNQNELDKTLSNIFGIEPSAGKEEVSEFVNFYKTWRAMKNA